MTAYRRRPVLIYNDDRSIAGLIVGTITGLVRAVVGGLLRLAWRYRSELAPVYVTAGVVLAGRWLHAHYAGWWPLPALVTAVAVVALVAVPRRWVRPWLWHTIERVYLTVIVASGGGWLTAAVAAGPDRPPLPALAALVAVVGAVPWWTHRRRRAKVRMEHVIDAWPDITHAAGLAGSAIVSATVGRWGWTARLALPRGQTARHVAAVVPVIESGLGARTGSVRVEPEPARADRAILRVLEVDPHAHPIPFPGTLVPATVRRPVLLGVFEDGTPVAVLLLRRNLLIGGIIGSGKSGLLNVIMAALVACPDVVIWGIDLKGGMELRPWAACLGRLATTPGEAVALLADVVAELDARTAEQADRGQRLWEPTPARPALVIVVDEYAELPDQAAPLADSIARRGRAVAATILAATQRPTQAAMGGGAVRSQMDVRICLRVRERRDVDLVLGQGMHTAGWHADTLDAPGKFLISAPEHQISKRARGFLITDTDVTAVAQAHAANRPVIPIRPADHSTREIAAATPDNADGENPTRTDVDQATQHERREKPDDILWATLRDAPPDGATIGDLMAATGMSRPWVYKYLDIFHKTGQARLVSRGRWAAPDPPDHPQ
jgi:DNA segregation ATPase FtsK/SpoIIIE, S-DNA-T family